MSEVPYINGNGEPLPWEADQVQSTGKCHFLGCDQPASFNKYFCCEDHQDNYYPKPASEVMKNEFDMEKIKAKIAVWKTNLHKNDPPVQTAFGQ